MILPLDSQLEPSITGVMWDKLLEDSQWQRDEIIRCSEEPWYWLVNYIATLKKDEFVPVPTVLRFPSKEYLRYVFHKCFSGSKLAVDKSRQLTMTWLLMAYELFRCQFGQHEECICQTKKETDADVELVQRAKFMVSQQPIWMRPEVKYSFCRLVFPDTASKIVGIPSGADQIRSHNPSRVFIDEGGFLENEFEGCRTAALACCQDIKIVSSANVGQFDDFINDTTVQR